MIQVIDSIPWVRCASGNVYSEPSFHSVSCWVLSYQNTAGHRARKEKRMIWGFPFFFLQSSMFFHFFSLYNLGSCCCWVVAYQNSAGQPAREWLLYILAILLWFLPFCSFFCGIFSHFSHRRKWNLVLTLLLCSCISESFTDINNIFVIHVLLDLCNYVHLLQIYFLTYL